MHQLLGFDEQVKILVTLVNNEGGRELFKQSFQEVLNNLALEVGEGMDSDIVLEQIACLKNLLQRQETWLLELRGKLNKGLEVIAEEWS